MAAPSKTQGLPCLSDPFTTLILSSSAVSSPPSAIFRAQYADTMSRPVPLAPSAPLSVFEKDAAALTPASFAAQVPLPDVSEEFVAKASPPASRSSESALESEELEPDSDVVEEFNEPVTYHPLFSDPDADTVLRSAEGTYYRVHSYTLRTTCGLFRTLFDLPQSLNATVRTTGAESSKHGKLGSRNRKTTPDPLRAPIPVFEPDTLLCPLLCLLHGLPLPDSSFDVASTSCSAQSPSDQPSTSSMNTLNTSLNSTWKSPSQASPLALPLSTLASLLLLAEKWDAPGPMSILRPMLLSPVVLAGPPSCFSIGDISETTCSAEGQYPAGAAALEVYTLARHFGWTDVAMQASSYTLSLDLLSSSSSLPCLTPSLSTTSSEGYSASYAIPSLSSKNLFALLSLHRARRDTFKALLDAPERFTAGNQDPYHCARCGITRLENDTWRALKARCIDEMECGAGAEGIVPSGDRLLRYPNREALGLPAMAEIDLPAQGSQLAPTETAACGNVGLEAWPQAKAAWSAACPKIRCGARNYDRVATLRQIRNCMEALVGEVEL
ncbi:hypothetical protein HGRIS_003908 [Hohenbuehelia grisea]|uniref:BTB domain-containing protein n=1 Tax=Hohenbuehelia grisea TaxID=104357 RepID=A0ABR3JGW1_9AGAR